ncbi:hypothetical protein F8388_013522, partial [Cannabis sativa]
CDNLATIKGIRKHNSYTTGCISSCTYADEVDLKSCSGIGCCKTSILRELVNYNLKLESNNYHKSVFSFSPCSYAFVMQETAFKFSGLEEFTNLTDVPVVLDWAVGSGSCEEAKRNMETFACKENSVCANSTSRFGYLCRCSEGYQGNPYLSNGCIDIDECKQQPNLCGNGTCINKAGSYTCSCHNGYTPRKLHNETVCMRNNDSHSKKLIIIYSVL